MKKKILSVGMVGIVTLTMIFNFNIANTNDKEGISLLHIKAMTFAASECTHLYAWFCTEGSTGTEFCMEGSDDYWCDAK